MSTEATVQEEAQETVRNRGCRCFLEAQPVRRIRGAMVTTVCARCGGFVVTGALPVAVRTGDEGA